MRSAAIPRIDEGYRTLIGSSIGGKKSHLQGDQEIKVPQSPPVLPTHDPVQTHEPDLKSSLLWYASGPAPGPGPAAHSPLTQFESGLNPVYGDWPSLSIRTFHVKQRAKKTLRQAEPRPAAPPLHHRPPRPAPPPGPAPPAGETRHVQLRAHTCSAPTPTDPQRTQQQHVQGVLLRVFMKSTNML